MSASLDSALDPMEEIRFRKRYGQIWAEIQKETHFTFDELEQIMVIFFKIQKRDDKPASLDLISRAHFRDVLHTGLGMTDAYMMERVMVALDRGTSPYVTMSTFAKAMSLYLRGDLEERITYAFTCYDLLGEGHLRRETMYQLMKKSLAKASRDDDVEEAVKMPITEQDWLTVERGFHNRFPHAIGAMDGKHVVLQAPFNSGSEYYNYKKSFSIVLLALVDSKYCFMYADIGCQGRISDGGVLKNSTLWHKMENNLLRLPPATPLPNGNISVPYVFLADGAFALHRTLMKPYPGEHLEGTKERIYNKKLSSARVVVENTFGVMASVFRVLRKPLLLQPEPSISVVMACVVLHNFLRMSKNSSASYNPAGTFDTYSGDTLIRHGSWRDNAPDNPAIRNIRLVPRRSQRTTVEIRNAFANHFHH